MNQSQLIGRLTKDLDLRYTSSGKAVATGTLAVNRRFKNANGEYGADFIQIQIWDKGAEDLANFTRKGSMIGVVGHVQTRNYENKEGQRIYVTEVVVDNFTLLEKKGDAGGQAHTGNNHSNNQSNFGGGHQPADPFAGNGQSIDISDDDLPF